MSIETFLRDLADRDIWITRNGDKLRLNAAEGALTPELKTQIATRKGEILEFLPDASAHHAPTFTLVRAPRDQDIPLSFAQQRLWFLHKLNPGDPAYNLGVGKTLTGPIDRVALDRSIRALVQRHEILRTVFHDTNGVPSQVVTDIIPELRVVEVPQFTGSTATQEERYEELRAAEVEEPFELAIEPAIRITLFRFDNEHSRLFVSIHHILGDGWSLDVLIHELTTWYEKFRAESAQNNGNTAHEVIAIATPQNTNEAWQYADYAYSERMQFEQTDQTKHIAFWKQRLGGRIPPLDLPMRRNSRQTSPRGETYNFVVPAHLTAQLRTLGQKSGVTMFPVLLGLFKTLLHRYSGQNDILVGTPVANRKRVELESLIGLFIGTLVTRTTFDNNPSFRDVIKRIHTEMLDTYEHQDYPFDKLVELVRPDRSLTQSPLFQTAFILNNTPTSGTYEVIGGGAIYEISLYVTDNTDKLTGILEYNAELFDEATMERMAGHFLTLAEAVVTNPDQPVATISILTKAEHHQLVDTWNHTSAPYPNGKTTHELIEQQARATPDAVALFEALGDNAASAVTLTYKELDQRANQLAHTLRKIGVSTDQRIGICVDRSAEMVVATLAVWKAGGAYVPLDPSYPHDRLAFMAEDAGLVALITEEQYLTTIADVRCPVICIDRDRTTIASEPTTAPEVSRTPHQLAYVIYTSGSTGKPKGVLIEHRSLVNLLFAMQKSPGLTPSDTLFSVTTLSFDIAGLELYLPLITGAKIALASREVATDPRALAHSMQAAGTTVMQATPATWQFLLDSGWHEGKGLKILCGGEALSPTLAKALLATGVELWNVYGPTETTIWSTATRITTASNIPIGRPIANTMVYVLDQNGLPVPIGVPGELHIGGDGVARGYLNRTDLTEDRFVANTFAHDSRQSRMYRTGDSVRYNEDGNLEYLGRLDNQVKIRGYRIELGEIEAVLSTHNQIQQAVVIVREDLPGDLRLVAYIIPTPNVTITATELKPWMTERLPQFMVPSAFVTLDAFPLTPNGKVDRRVLPSPTSNHPNNGTQVESDRAPANALEAKLLPVWEQVLGISGIGRHDNFFDLGGNSLLGIRLLAAIEKAIDQRVPVAVIFQGQTIATMAETLRTDDVDASLRAVAVQANGSQPPLFFIPGVNGNVIGYEELARDLGNDQPLYGLRSVGLEGEAEPLTNIPAIAEQFVTDIRKIQPEGPYHLIGFCIGGLVAYEIAQQLTAQDEAVDVLGLIDTWPPEMIESSGSTSRLSQKIAYVKNGLSRHWQALLSQPPSQRMHYLKEKSAIIIDMIAKRDVYRGEREVLHQDLVIRANKHAASAYSPKEYPGSIFLIVTKGNTPTGKNDPRLTWKSFAKSAEVSWVLGLDSGALLKAPYLDGLVNALHKVLPRRNK